MCENNKKIIPIVYSTDKNYLPILSVSLTSILDNVLSNTFYKFYIFHTTLEDEDISKMQNYNTENSEIIFVNVKDKIESIFNKLCVRDNYNDTIYYRFFIPKILSQYEKVIYLDCDTVIKADLGELYDTNLDKNILGVISDEAVNNEEIFSQYTSDYLGVLNGKYFNSGVLLINVKEYNANFYDEKLHKLINTVKFKVAPDQDYLNVLFHGKVKYLDLVWNKMPITSGVNESDIKIIHYNLNYKPWHFDGIMYEDDFWKVAKRTKFYEYIKQLKENYGEKEKKISENNLRNLIAIIYECLSSKVMPFTRREIF